MGHCRWLGLLLLCVFVHPQASELKARIPPTLTFEAAVNDYLLQRTLDEDRIVETALANDPSNWRRYQESLGDSFKAERFIDRYRSTLRERLIRHDEQARYRTRGVLLVEAEPIGQGDRFAVRPPGRLDARLVNPNLYGFGRGLPLLLIKQVLIDFPDPSNWRLRTPPGWGDKLASRKAREPLALDATYDFKLSDCRLRQRDRTLICEARFESVEAHAGRVFDQATPIDKRLTAAIQGPIDGI